MKKGRGTKTESWVTQVFEMRHKQEIMVCLKTKRDVSRRKKIKYGKLPKILNEDKESLALAN